MALEAVMQQLESMGSERTRSTYLRHGAREPLFGVTFGDLRPLARRVGSDPALARSLWATGNSDARLLACMVADPTATSEAELDAWLADIDSSFLVDVFVAELASRVPGVQTRAERWIASERDRTAQAGWDLVDALALSAASVPDAYFETTLDLIAERIHDHGDWTRRSASGTITGIGLRNEELEAKARSTARRMGDVEFDPGQTACVMPDAIACLEKTKAHRARQAARRSGRSSGATAV